MGINDMLRDFINGVPEELKNALLHGRMMDARIILSSGTIDSSKYKAVCDTGTVTFYGESGDIICSIGTVKAVTRMIGLYKGNCGVVVQPVPQEEPKEKVKLAIEEEIPGQMSFNDFPYLLTEKE